VTDAAIQKGEGSFDRDKFVAFAFCWADALIELDSGGFIRYAAGTIKSFTGKEPSQLVGTEFDALVADGDKTLVRELMRVASRRGRIENAAVRLVGPYGITAPLAFAGYCLEDLGGHYFFALRAAATASFGADGRRLTRNPVSGLYDADDFAGLAGQRLKAAEAAGTKAELTLVAMPELSALKLRLDEEQRRSLVGTLSAALRANSLNGDSAAEIEDGKFAVVHEVSVGADEIEAHLARVAREIDPQGKGTAVESATLDLGDDELDDEDLANGLVYAINQFREAKGRDFSLKNFSTNMAVMVDQAMTSVRGFRRVLDESSFDIAFHPIVDVKSGVIHHYEALTRFRGHAATDSPYKFITFAEEVGLIWRFDIAMARKVVSWLSSVRKKGYKVAVNISGQSIANLSYLAELYALLSANTWAKDNVMFEITESARIADLADANRFFQTLRGQGYEVCLDDFGAGAASFQYLSSLDVDVVKLDGTAVKNALIAKKGRAFLTALAKLCQDIHVETVAEMIDDKETLAFVRDCGVNYAQGYLFGEPASDIGKFTSWPELFTPKGKGK
jgi:EAL domain-containing protein (putative c-di-GMP-specific phosphodiesterase class I)